MITQCYFRGPSAGHVTLPAEVLPNMVDLANRMENDATVGDARGA